MKKKSLFKGRRLTRIAVVAGLIVSLITTSTFAAESYASMSNVGSTRTHAYSSDDYIIIDGVDVSAWNSLSKDDWVTLKKQGIDFVFIRTSGTFFGKSKLTMYEDVDFETNYNNAKNAGMMIGAYHYTSAVTTAEAKKEAAECLRIIDGRELDLPIVFDSECNTDRCYNLRFHGEKRINNALAFDSYIRENSDYSTMYYSYLNMMNNEPGFKKNVSELEEVMPIWVAQYNSTCDYKGSYNFWQHTSSALFNSGRIGPLDANFWYFKRDSRMVNTETGKPCNVKAKITMRYYKGYALNAKPEVTYNGKVLQEGVDYKLNYVKNVKVGKGYAIVTGMGDYSGQAAVSFTIKKQSLKKSGAVISDIADSYGYTGDEIRPVPTVTLGSKTLVKDKDYTVSYSSNLNAGTATVTVKGTGIYQGSVSETFEITPAPLDPDKFTLSDAPYTGSPVEAKITTDYQDKDYTVTYRNNRDLGTATAVITGTGNCTGKSFTKEFRIYLPAPSSVTPTLYGMDDIKISWTKVTGADKYVVYYKNSQMKSYKKLITTDKTSYDFPDLEDGIKYSFKVTSYRNDIRGRTRIKSVYTLKKMSKPAITKSGTSINITWDQVSGADGYEISRSADRYETDIKYDFPASSVCSKTVSVRKNVTYYYKIRAYKQYGDKRVYGTWSTVRSFMRY